MLQQKVFNNLKQLNEVIDMKRKSYKKTEKKPVHFKTADENVPPPVVNSFVDKKQVVVNIQVKPVNYENLRKSLDVNHPATTKEQ